MLSFRKETNGDTNAKDKRLWEDDDEDHDESDFNSKRTRTDTPMEVETGR